MRVEPLEPLELKGKSEPVEAYRLARGASATTRRSRATSTTPLVGRERERQRLWRDFEDAVADRTCRLFTLLGPAGIGKSRLVADFLERVGDSADVLRGRCLSLRRGHHVLAARRDARSARRRAGERRRLDARGDASRVSPAPRGARRRAPAGRRGRRPAVGRARVRRPRRARRRPLARRADLPALRRAHRAARRPSRTGAAGSSMRRRSCSSRSATSELRDADRQPARRDATSTPTLRERITAASAGNPLYVEEMLAMVREQRRTATTRRAADDPGAAAGAHRLARPRRAGRARARQRSRARSSTRGRRGARRRTRLRPALETHLATSSARSSIRPERSLIPGEDAYRFRHLLIREAAYAAMPKELRAQLHERYAEWLERSATSPPSSATRSSATTSSRRSSFVRSSGRETRSSPPDGSAAPRRRHAGLGRADHAAAGGLLQRAVEVHSADDRTQLRAMFQLARVLMRRRRVRACRLAASRHDRVARAVGDKELPAPRSASVASTSTGATSRKKSKTLTSSGVPARVPGQNR